MKTFFTYFVAALTLLATGSVLAAGGDLGQTDKQPTNWVAISMFAGFVIMTLFITKWAASKTKSAADFYTGGGGITGFQNGLAIAGDGGNARAAIGGGAGDGDGWSGEDSGVDGRGDTQRRGRLVEIEGDRLGGHIIGAVFRST